MIVVLWMLCVCLPQIQDMQDAANAEALAERVSESLQQVDEALLEASQADAVTDELERARQFHLAAIRDLEELIRQVKYRRRPSGSSGSGGGGGSSSSQPEPQPSDASQSPEPGAEMPTGEPSGGEQPQDGKSEGADGRDEAAGGPPPPSETGSFTRSDTDGRWGLLPPKLQERLMNLHVDDVPARYRQHLRAYIQRLRREERP